jgi:hypothetical protein
MVLALTNDLTPPEPAIAGPSRRFAGRQDEETIPDPRHPAAVVPRRQFHSCPMAVLTNAVVGSQEAYGLLTPARPLHDNMTTT